VGYVNESATSIYRRRRRRRALVTMTFVTFLLVGSLAYSAPYIKAIVANLTSKSVASASCTQTTSTPALTPNDIYLNVYNATARVGLAASAADALLKQGFQVATVDNDPLSKPILGVGQIRYGPSGLPEAQLVAKWMPGATMVQDGRIDASVDFVVGQKFKSVTVPPTMVFSKVVGSRPHC
jgi:hypothetical protein